MNSTVVLSFRAYKDIKPWLDYACKGFERGEVLRLVVTRAALEQVLDAGVIMMTKDLVARQEHIEAGDTRVFSVRLTEDMCQLIRERASKQNKTTSEWCALALLHWQQYFSNGYTKHKDEVTDSWLPQHAAKYRSEVAELSAVYSQKQSKQPAKVGG